jgi:hypothetical protein
MNELRAIFDRALEPLTAEQKEKFLEMCGLATRLAYEDGDKRVLIETMWWCMSLGFPLFNWAQQAFIDAYHRSWKGELKSWDQVFGKPFRGKTAKGAAAAARAGEVYYQVSRRMAGGSKIPAVFADVGEALGLSASTVRDAYYDVERSFPSMRAHRKRPD